MNNIANNFFNNVINGAVIGASMQILYNHGSDMLSGIVSGNVTICTSFAVGAIGGGAIAIIKKQRNRDMVLLSFQLCSLFLANLAQSKARS